MPETLTRKIIADRLVGESGQEIELRVDQILLEDATGTMACLQFEQLGIDRVQVPTVSYVDHNVLQFDNKNPEDHAYLRSWAARYGALYSRPGNGISHYLHLERFARPGGFLLGADSHTTMAGALGMLAIGAGATEVAVAMGGRPYVVERPQVAGVELRGRLRPWVQSKDVVLELLRRRGVRGGRGRDLRVLRRRRRDAHRDRPRDDLQHGDGDRGDDGDLPERRADAGVARARRGARTSSSSSPPTPGRSTTRSRRSSSAEIEPLIALPSSPGNVVPVAEAAGTPTRQVCVGSSVNSSYEDVALVAAVLRGRTLPPELDLTVSPGSRQILDMLVRSGVYSDLLATGARILEPACGPCIGMGQAPAAGAASVRTFNRNFPGRSGTPGDQVYLCSPATAAATALRGAITDPRELGEPAVLVPPPRIRRSTTARSSTRRATAAGVELEKGPNIVPPPPVPALPETIEGRVLIVVPDDVSTGDMAPDGALGLAIWSNIPACARYMFRRFDPEFPARAEEWGGGIVVGGHNYGQGSSREQAAFAALYLGVRAVVAKSFARIHRSNLIAQGILPLVLADETDFERIEVGQPWSVAVDLDAGRSRGRDAVRPGAARAAPDRARAGDSPRRRSRLAATAGTRSRAG